MASEDVYILGINMTKFGKHKELDTLDLASEATLAALKDGGVTMADMNIIAAGNLMGGASPIAQLIQKQCGQTGIPAYNVSNACATGATALRVACMAIKAGEADFGLAVGVSRSWRVRVCSVPAARARPATSGSARGATARWRRWMVASARRTCRAPSRRSAWSTPTSTAGPTSSCLRRSARRTMVTRRSTRSRPTPRR